MVLSLSRRLMLPHQASVVNWQVPVRLKVKINVNATFIEKEEVAELGAIARDGDELVMGGCTCKCHGIKILVWQIAFLSQLFYSKFTSQKNKNI